MIVIESINHIGITVSNLEESVKFYKELFDFDTIDKASGPGLTFMRVADVTIGLYEVPGFKNADNSKTRISLYVDEEDFEDAVEEIQDREIEIVFGPENIRKGKTVVFLDPDKNQIELSYPLVG
ncbi:MAG: VOC family protein [Spirochaetes bacterium]|nr:VOC family protein [Spirochaetota bacterium]